jgi:hypothetical protein
VAAFIVLVSIGLLAGGILDFLYTRPLTAEEQGALAQKRRARDINSYFAYSSAQAHVNPDFKKRMRADGKFYAVDEELAVFPSLAAGLLKYKKHEWIVIALERERRVHLMWVNKGPDNERVGFLLPLEAVAQFTEQDASSSVLLFHNHPNTDPHLYDCRLPSPTDLEGCRTRAQFFNERGISVAEFVCERGRAYRYGLSAAEGFLPLRQYEEKLSSENGTSRIRNLSLHWERVVL